MKSRGENTLSRHRETCNGRDAESSRGNPPVFDRRFFAELLRLQGDRGGQSVIAAHPESVIELSLPVAMGHDVDSSEDWPA